MKKQATKGASDRYTLDEDQVERLKKLQLGIYRDLSRVCDKHGLTLFAGYGTALGAVRHKGFIPWDDDMDFLMLRREYDRLADLFDEELGDRYELQIPSLTPAASFGFMKIRLKNTRFVEVETAGLPIHKGVFIDIFPLENIPSGTVKRFIHGTICNLLNHFKVAVSYWRYPSGPLREMLQGDPRSRWIFRIRRLIGFLFSFRSPEAWNRTTDRFCARYKDDTPEYLSVPYAHGKYFENIHHIDHLLPGREVPFEQTTVRIPSDSDTYLTQLYGDYMQIPPLEKREKHWAVEFTVE